MKRVATISIIVEKKDAEIIQNVNELLHEYQDVILGRMGLPLKDLKINIIYIVILAEENNINALTGKLGRIDGINAKTLFSKNSYD